MDATRPSLKRLTDPSPNKFNPLHHASSSMWFGSFSDRFPSSTSTSRHSLTQATTSSPSRLSSDLPSPLQHHHPQPSQLSPLPSLAKGKAKASAPLAQNFARLKGSKDVLIHVVDKHDTLAGIALSYGISLSALRKANGMWTSDPLSLKDTLRIPLELCNLPPSKKIEIEQDSGKVLIWEQSSAFSPSSSSSPPRRKSTNGLWAYQNAQVSAPFRDAHSTQRFSSHHSHNSSQISLEMSTNTGTSSDLGPSPKRETFHWHSKALGPSCPIDEFPDYLSATNHNYRNSAQCPSPPEPLDAGIPLARNPGILSSICNSTSPPPQPNTHQPKVIATLERVPARELGFFPTAPSLDPETTTTLLPDLSSQNTLNLPCRVSSSTLRQRSATSSNLLAASTSQRQLATSHNSQSTSTSTPTPIASPRSRIPTQLQFDSQSPQTLSNDDDLSQTSPGLEKKKLVPPQTRYPTFSSPSQKSTMPLSTRSTSLSKWTTVRPGVPPPLDRRLKFLEEGSTGTLGSLFQSALNPLLGQQQESQPQHIPLNLPQGHEERVELVRLPAKDHHEQGSFWGFWDDLLDEADQARRK